MKKLLTNERFWITAIFASIAVAFVDVVFKFAILKHFFPFSIAAIVAGIFLYPFISDKKK